MGEIFKAMDSVMHMKHPISNRRVEYATMTMKDGEDAGNFLRRIQAGASAADMKKCPLEAHMLLNYSQALTKTKLNRSIKKYVFEELHKDQNKDDISNVIQTIEAMTSDDKRRECFLCDRKHKFRPT